MPEKPNERAARNVVATSLGVRVCRFEDGTADSQVDALILGSDGPEAMEIIADHEAAFNAQWAALERIGHRLEVPGLQRVWSVQLARSSRVKELANKLPGLLLRFEAALDPTADQTTWPVPQEMARLGIRMVYPVEGDDRAGQVHLNAEGWAGFSSSQTMAQYVEQVLSIATDVPSKLARHRAAAKHALIWTTVSTEYGIQVQLERRDQALPTDAPVLPDGVTHVWVVGSMTSQGALAWFPGRGWWRPAWVWPASEPVIMGDDEPCPPFES